MACNCKHHVIQPTRNKGITNHGKTAQDKNTVSQNNSNESNNSLIYSFYGL